MNPESPCPTLHCGAVPPEPPGTQYSNDPVSFVGICPEGQTTIITGNLPGWITLAGNDFVGAAGNFRGPTKAAANLAAQTALDSFVNTAFGDGRISCETGPCGFDPSLASHTYGISGYFEGMLLPPRNTSNTDPLWAGNFINYHTSLYFSNQWNAPSPITVSGVQCLDDQVILGFNGCVDDVPTWQIRIEDFLGEFYGIWNKVGGNTPVGTYVYQAGSGVDGQPDLTIEQLT